MGVLVTGGAGFIGTNLIDKLIQTEKVFCLDNFDEFYDSKIKRKNIEAFLKNKNFKLLEGNIRDKPFLEKVFSENDFDKVIHLAAKAGVRLSLENPLIYSQVNIDGTVNLLDLSKDHKIKNFVFASSSSVYGNNKKVPFTEKDFVDNPVSPYAASKKAGELFCYTYHHLYQTPITCLRFFTVYGPGQRPEMAIHKFTRLIDQGKEIQLYGDGSTKRDYTYISDIVEGIISALNKNLGFEVINLGNSKTVELKELIEIIEKNLGKKAKIKYLSEQPGDVKITFADISKAKQLLGYNPKTGIQDGVKKFVEWYLKNKEVLN